MTPPTLPLPASPHGLTYARARLFLGITAVGSAVVLASSLLYAQLPSWGMSTSEVQSVAAALLQIGIAFAAVQVAFQIVDLMGGVWLVRRRDGAFRWLARWARGSAVQWMVWMCSCMMTHLCVNCACMVWMVWMCSCMKTHLCVN